MSQMNPTCSTCSPCPASLPALSAQPTLDELHFYLDHLHRYTSELLRHAAAAEAACIARAAAEDDSLPRCANRRQEATRG